MTAEQTLRTPLVNDPRPPLAPQGARVLFATDESDEARAAEEWIRRLRWARTPAIDVVTIAPRPGWVSGLGLQTYRTAVREAVRQARETELVEAQRVANAAAFRLQRAGMPVRVWARAGEIADEIVRASRLEPTDLIVIGHSGRSALALIRGGGVSGHVSREADVPVLVAHAPPHGHERLPQSIAMLDTGETATAAALRWLDDAGWLDETHVTMVATHGGQPVDDVHALIDATGIDLVVIPRTPAGREAKRAMEISETSRVSVLLVPSMR